MGEPISDNAVDPLKPTAYACHALCRTERRELMSHREWRIMANTAPRYGSIVPPFNFQDEG